MLTAHIDGIQSGVVAFIPHFLSLPNAKNVGYIHDCPTADHSKEKKCSKKESLLFDNCNVLLNFSSCLFLHLAKIYLQQLYFFHYLSSSSFLW